MNKEMRKNEMIDWQAHPSLNQVTKMTIKTLDSTFPFEDYKREREELEGPQQNKADENSDFGNGSEDDEAEEEAQV